MPENNIFNLPPDSVFTAFWVLVLSTWGGIAGYVRKIKQGMTKRFSVTEMIGEIIISSFVGVITYFLCKSSGVDETVSAALVGLSGHMGSRAIYVIEVFLRKQVDINLENEK